MLKTKLIALTALSAFFAQAISLPVYAAAARTANKAVVAKEDSQLALQTAIKNFKASVDLGIKNVRDAGVDFAKEIETAGITSDQIMVYVQKNTSAAEYARFQASLENATRGLSGDALAQMSEQELGQVMAQALAATDSHGLAWSGCTGATIGVILIVGAVVVGIIALVKNKGEERIRADFDARRNSRTQEYNNDVAYYENRPNQIPNEIASLQSESAEALNDIAYWNGVLDASLGSTDPEDIAAAQNANNQINNLTDLIEDNNAEIAQLTIELANYNDEEYVASLFAQLEIDYNQDMQNYDTDEANQIALVPQNKETAKVLGISAGIGAAIGTYLAIDGFSGC